MPDKDLVLEFASFHEVLDNYARRLSEEGIFFATSEPHDEGSEVGFHIRIRDGFSVLKGQGEVVQSSDEGLFLRLIHLDQPSLKLLPKLLEHYRRQGVALMELPRVATVEAPNRDLTADDLFESEETTPDSVMGLGLTLDDLEAEFQAETPGSDPAAEVEVDLTEPGPVLTEVEELADDSKEEALVVAEMVEPEVDVGLPWLPEEPEKSSRKDFWVILLLVLLGAVLGAAFYVFVIRPNAQRSSQTVTPAPLEKPEPVVEPRSVAMDIEEPVSIVETPLTGVDRITWVDEAGETVVTLWADGSFLAAQVDDFRVDGEQPREVVRIRGVQRPFPQHLIELGTDHVRRIRTGFHQEDGINTLHIVADLVDIDVELLRTEASGEQLRVYFSKTG